jgi:lipoprotein NlpD
MLRCNPLPYVQYDCGVAPCLAKKSSGFIRSSHLRNTTLELLLMAALLAGCSSASGPAAPVAGVNAHPAARFKDTAGRSYTVQAGDTLYRIALDQDVEVEEIVAWNGLNDANRIYPGRRLRMEAPAAPIRNAGQTGTPRQGDASRAPARPLAQREAPAETTSHVAPVKYSPGPTPDSSPALPSGWVWPASGEVAVRFDPAAGNKGIDIVAEAGTPVRAAASGRVAYAGEGPRGYGQIVIIKHDAARLSVYAHQSRVEVKEGQSVPRGMVIGEMGRTGSSRVKLHFEIREYGKPVDPTLFLPTT